LNSGLAAEHATLMAASTRSNAIARLNVRYPDISPEHRLIRHTYRLPGNWRTLTIGGTSNWQSDRYRAANRPIGRDRPLQRRVLG
jgi:outer membrane receptor for ferric coprogen and ferric-rhodotorulic acid